MKDSVIVGQVSPYAINEDVFAVELYFTGCQHKCKNCHNKELWNYISDYEKDVNSVVERLSNILSHELVKEVHLLGGEPLYNEKRVLFIYNLILSIKNRFPDVKFVLFTGFDFDYVKRHYQYLLDVVDYVKTGRYDERCSNKKFLHNNFYLATENQNLWKKTDSGFSLVI